MSSTLYSKVLLTVPSKDRIESCPVITVMAVTAMIFIISFQTQFADLSYAVTSDLFIQPEILDSLALFQIPAVLLFSFVFSQVRVRLNLKFLNAWSIVHAVFVVISAIAAVIYIFARVDRVFSFTDETSSVSKSIQGLINVLSAFTKNNANFQKVFGTDSTGFKALCYFVSFAFPIEIMIALLFCTMACSLFGEKETTLIVRNTDGQYDVLTDKGKKGCCK